jgi:hypothetical protein
MEIGHCNSHIRVEGPAMTTPRYAYDDGYPVRFTGREAWALYADNKWREISLAFALCKCGELTEYAYLELFGHYLPPLPDHAFSKS